MMLLFEAIFCVRGIKCIINVFSMLFVYLWKSLGIHFHLMACSLSHSSILHTYLVHVAAVHICDWTVCIKACPAGSWMKPLHSDRVTTLKVLLQSEQSAKGWRNEPSGYKFIKPFSHRALFFPSMQLQSNLFYP